MSLTLTDQDKLTLRTAAYGAVSLLAAAGVAGGLPHKLAAEGSMSLARATGPIGHVLADKTGGVYLTGTSVAELTDQVLPTLTKAMNLLKKKAPAEADNFRGTVIVAIETAARSQWREPSPSIADMTRRITRALDAA
ncbi:hypothetical protein AB0M47_15610 [Hamadaea sp. NPDC051192]|uniref:hypothetical protein n=1 Tax=Hamadaea sp. NPDC051192 TaxID=3154940 RepID=UPI0034152CCF